MNTKLRGFLDADGRLSAYPAKRRARIHALCYLAQRLEPGVIYSEKDINQMLNRWHSFGDPATLRRDLYDHGLLNRSRDGQTYQLADDPPTAEALEAKFL